MYLQRISIIIFSILFATNVAFADESNRKISITLMVATSSKVDSLSATAFGVSLAGWFSENEDIKSFSPGKYKPSFLALLSAYSSQIQIWRELKENEDPNSKYMDNLILVDDNGFLKEYVWVNHDKNIKGKKPEGLRKEEYIEWSTNELVGHVPRIEARLNIE